MELLNKEQGQGAFLKACEKFIKKHPSKNITGYCENCFLYYIQSNLNFRDFTKNSNNHTDCYRIASFLQDAGLIKIKSGIITKNKNKNEDRTMYYVDCDKFSFLNSFGKNKI